MGVGAPRWALRQGSKSYGMQQGRILRNARKRDEGTPSDGPRVHLFARLNIWRNKVWARSVPAAAVTPTDRVVSTNIGPKESVAGLLSSL